MKVIGFKKSSFTSDKDEVINFGRLYVTYPPSPTEKGVTGMLCEEVKLSPELIPNGLKVGDDVRLNRNAKGRVESVEVV